jgi:hypothetical protein
MTATWTDYPIEPRQVAVAVSGTDVEISPTRVGRSPRVAFQLIPTTAAVTVSYALGGSPAVLNAGLTATQLQPIGQSANNVAEALQVVWQGPIHAIASGAGNVAVFEQFAP